VAENMGSAVSLIGSIASIYALVQGATTPYEKLLLSIACLFLVFLVLLLQRKRLRHSATLLDPDALTLLPDKVLVGRNEDVDNLLHYIKNEPMVWLVGESGSGKTALLRAGVLRSLRKISGTLVIYVSGLGADWTRGPREAAFAAFNQACDGSQGLKHMRIGRAEELFGRLEGFWPETGRLPILLFDQFDDYQIQHRQKFTTPRRTVISPKQLLHNNAFWGEIAQLVKSNSIHCLFATTDDAQYLLEPFRFCVPELYHLDRLKKGCVRAALNELTAGDVVANYENGWETQQGKSSRKALSYFYLRRIFPGFGRRVSR
jgi:hypothetical protein